MPNATSKPKYRFTVLGSGTSSGVPTISCDCQTCLSDDPRDKRLRTSLLVESETTTIVIDTTPDFRQQMLKYKVKRLDAVLYTHAHFDHIGGFDDLRAFNYTSRKEMPVYLTGPTLERLRKSFFYAFEKPDQIGGGVPLVTPHIIHEAPFSIGDIYITPITLFHGRLEVLGFRIGRFAWCTDTNYIPEESLGLLKNLDYLILDALRYKRHQTHFNLEEAVEASRLISAKSTYFIHIAHQIMHSECEPMLPPGVMIAFDGLVIESE